jgi:amino acid adenylation domain-containing protein
MCPFPTVQSKQADSAELAERALTLSFGQQRLWFLAQMEGVSEAYHLPMCLRLNGELDGSVLKRALDRIVSRHEVLRTSFRHVDGEPVAYVAAPDQGFELQQHDPSGREQAGIELERLTMSEARSHFDLEHGPLIRGQLIRLTEHEHVLLITMHQIISDVWSMPVLTNELSTLYQAYRAREEDPLPPPIIQYADYARSEQQRLSGEVLQRESEYWRDALEGAPVLLDLSTDRPRPARQVLAGDMVELQLDAVLTQELKALCARHRITLSTLVAAGWAAVLSRLSMQEEVMIGLAVPNRPLPGPEGVIGPFANMLVLRVEASGTVEELLQELETQMLDAQKHQLPFEQVVEIVKPPRTMSHAPIFQVLLAWQDWDWGPLHLPGLNLIPERIANAASEFDLELDLRESTGRIVGGLSYATALFDRETVERHVSYLRQMLEAMAASEKQAVEHIDLLNDAERTSVLRLGNGGPGVEFVPGSANACLYELVTVQAKRTPEAIAVIEPGREITYGQLAQLANGVGQQLIEFGCGPEARVATLADRSAESLTGVLGILAAGGAYVPLDPSFPDERLAFVLNDASVQVLLTPAALAERANSAVRHAEAPTKVVVIADAPKSESAPDSAVTLANAAYVIYTSGSTGTPKGVVVEHRSIVNLVQGFAMGHSFTGHRLLMIPPLVFDASVGAVFPALAAGAAIVLHPAPAELGWLELERFCREYRITAIDAPAALWRRWTEAATSYAGTYALLPDLKLMMIGGESVSLEHVRRFAQLTGNRAVLVNHYGPTEASVCATMLIVPDISALSGTDLPIGKPLPGVQVYVLDGDLRLAPQGAAGELFIGGAGVAREYLNRPELNAGAFLRDPFSPNPAARMYRTGDLVRWNADDTLQFVGRRDHQIKIRGLRVELGEIEARLAEHPGIREAVVLAREDRSGDRRLVAYVITGNADDGLEWNGLRKTLRTDQITEWGIAFDEMYQRDSPVEGATFNIAGWNSSYTGQPIPPEEMRVWVETTVERILSLRPRRVWEIGCGTGLLLFRIAPRCEYFLGTDITSSGLESLEQEIRHSNQNLPQVTLKCKPAHEFESIKEEERFDSVVLNSVVQYFPDIEYLTTVITGAVEALRPGGAVFIGDVRSFPLLETFHASVQLSQAPTSLSCDELWERVQKNLRLESELVIDPEFFTVLRQRIPQISRLEINLKRGRADNELTNFRYDVVLHVGDPGPQMECQWLDWNKQNLSLDSLREVLNRTQPEVLGVTGVPNARVRRDVTAVRILTSSHRPATAGELRDVLDSSQQFVVAPEDIWALEEHIPYTIEIRWSRNAVEECDLLFRRKTLDGKRVSAAGFVRFPEETDSLRPQETYATDPLRQRLAGRLVHELRRWLKEKLPEYMVPSAYVSLAKFPLTSNGKLDRKALPAPDVGAYLTRDYAAPVGSVESALARIWAEVLNLERVGRNDNFFELGGHSLLGATVIKRMREAGFQVDVRALFEAPTLLGLAEVVGSENRTVVVPPNLIPAGCTAITPDMLPMVSLSQSEIDKIMASIPGGTRNVQDIYPLTPMQEGFLFHHLLEKQGDVYLSPTMFSFDSREHVDRYANALRAVIGRHDILRTGVFWEGLPEPVQAVWRHAPLMVEEVTLDAAAGDIAAQLLARFDPQHYRIDVRRPPLWRLFIAEDVPNNRWVVLELMHHLVGDHVTLQVMQEEIQTIVLGQAERLPSPLPFRNFVAQARLGVSREEHEAFFTRMLGDVDELTAPFGLTDAQRDGSRIVEASREVDPEVCRQLHAHAGALSVTPASIFHLAWALVLARISGRDDVVFGTVMFGRMQGREGADRTIGVFINTLPVRIQFGNDDVRASVHKTHELLTQLLRHEHASLALAQRCSSVRPPAPLFASLVNYRHVGDGEAVLVRDAVSLQGGGNITETSTNMKLLLGRERSNYPFDVSINNRGQGFSMDVQVDESIDPQRVCALMHTALESLVTALERDPTTPVRSLDILPPAERHQLLVEWNATKSEYPRDLCIHELFEEQAERTPGAVAVEIEGEPLTYAELNHRANQLGRFLKKLGAGPDVLVGICMERGLEMMVGMLGVLKAGAAYVPLDPAHPKDRLAYMVRDAKTEILLTHSQFRNRLPNYEGQLIELDKKWQTISRENGLSLVSNVQAENLAYLIYTSGSTGKPKGVAVEHRQVCNQLLWAGAALDLGPADRVLQKASFGFDASIVEIFLPLAQGAQIIIARPGSEQDVDYLVRLILEKAITFMDLVPALLGQMLDHPMSKQWTSLRVTCSGADVLKPDLVRTFHQSAPGVLWNTYGPTEATVQSAFFVCSEGDQSTPIGKPIANTQIYILDPRLEPTPTGVPGEIYIGGAGVARGYLNRPKLTAERFLPDPFTLEGQGRMYRTGDLGRWLPDGNIEFLGRNDSQVKLRGFRIELGEIEARLAEHPSVREAVVLAREDQPGDKRLVAYITATESTGDDGAPATLDVEALRTHLSSLLPDYMVPAAYVSLAQFPLTPNGKLDRKGLPSPDIDAYLTRGYEEPVGEMETTVARIWAEVLKLERVGRNDNFFELGGHSLLAVSILSRLRSALEIDVSLKDLFGYSVLATFVQAMKGVAHIQLSPVTPASRAGLLPLSFAQQRLWFLAQIEGVSEAYHMPMGLRLSGQLDRHALKRALERIVWRHEALRTTFQRVDGQPAQCLGAPDSGFALQEHDLSGHEQAAAELARRTREEASRRFDLEHGPLIRGQLIRLAAQEHVLLITMHHIVSDGWSMGVLTNELSALYQAYRAGDEDPLPPLEIQYADYALWQRQRLTGESLQRQAEYWRRTLEGAPTLLELPTDRPRPAQQTFAGDAVELELDAALTRGLKALSQRHGMTLYMLVVAGWAAVLSRLSGQQEVVMGTAIANRTRPEIEGLIGFFVNALALRVEVSGSATELLQRVKMRTLEAQEHQELPFERVVEIVKPPRSLAHGPIFQVMLVWQSNDEGTLHLSGLNLVPEQITYGVAKFDLELDLGEIDDRIVGELRYATALFDRGTIERHAGYLRQALTAMVADERQAVDRIDLLDDAERELLESWNSPGTTYVKEQCIHELFEEQAARTPGAVAVSFEGQKLSYRDLNRQANRLAHYLRSLGVKPDDRVALCMERSAEMVVAILGVLKAGGAYVPLDPAYPLERLEYMLADSAPRVLLVHLSDAVRKALHPMLTTASIPVVDLQTDAQAWVKAPEIDLGPGRLELKPHHLAYVIYTSGSTGKPKGVMVEHANIVRLLSATQDWFHFNGNDVWTLFHSYAFDFSVWEIWGALAYGGRLVVVPQLTTRSPQEFYTLLGSECITILNQTPSAFRQLIAAQAGAASNHRLRHVIFGGEALEVSSLRPWYQRQVNRETRLINMYGITETTVHVTYRPLQQADTMAVGPSPIGCRIPDLTIYVLDRHRQLAPIGVAGELYVGGAGVARGYLNREELTAERFLADPFSPDPQARMYKTGDVGRFRADGNLEYLGRNDDQVKIRGFRIELGEIEARLAEHPSVGEAAVLAREDNPGDKRLVAYITPKEDAAVTAGMDVEALRAHLNTLLPDYMVPAAYVSLAKLPLTPNGKLDRKALPSPDTAAYLTRGYEPPVNEVEATVAGIWAEVLKLERVGRNDNFFELGGHSLLAMTLIERMRKAGLPVDVRALFTSPTLKGLAESAGGENRAVVVPPNLILTGSAAITPEMLPLVRLSQQEIDRIVADVPGGAANVQDIYPLAPLQEGILFHHLLEKRGDVYLTTTLLGAEERERLDRYVEALQAVIDRHDILRTSVAWEGLSEPVQVVWRQAPLTVEQVRLDPAAGDIAVQLQARFDPRHYRLDVRQAPMWRLFIAEDAPNQRWVMLELTHHLVDDNTSVRFLLGEIQAILQGQPEPLPVPLPFRNFVAQAHLGVSRQEHEAFFTRLLGDVDEPTAPFGLTDVQGDGSQIVEASREVDPELCRRLRAQARALGVTAASLCHLAWALVLARASGRDDVVFGTVLFGRMQGGEGADRALGVFINTLPVRIKIGDEDVRASVRKTHELLTQLLRHEHAPLALVQRCSSVRAPAPLFTSLLNYRHIRADALSAEKSINATQTLVGLELLGGQERTNYPFSLFVNDLGQAMSLDAQVDGSIDPNRVCSFMHTALESLTAALESAAGSALGSLRVLPEEEREQVLYGWNATQADYPRDKCIHELFEEQVTRTPQATAVVFEDESVNYAELNRRSNRLAHYLRAIGVRADQRVGICAGRGIEMIVGLLAVLKAGSAYVPLDPGYPEERLQYMVKDSRPVAMLTQRYTKELVSKLASGIRVIELDGEAGGWKGEAETNPERIHVGLTPEHLAYVIYTSGSTGIPKGVMLEHRNTVNFICWAHRVFSGEVLARTLFSTSLNFDLAVYECFVPLTMGAGIRVVPNALDLARGEVDVTLINTVPSVMRTLIEEKAVPPAVQVVNLAGEPLPRALVEGIFATTEVKQVCNLYGPTETTTYSTWVEMKREEGFVAHVGRPIANTRVYILDKRMEPVPLGVVGEIYIGGAGVGRGYLNREELTAERFVRDRFAKEPGTRMYRTGDLGRWLGDGNIMFLGRNDFQVKIRGFRIELGEIEARLREHDGVREAVVTAREDQPGEPRLVAYYTGGVQAEAQAEDLRRHLAARLPEYMVPAAYVWLAKLPLTRNGKLDRKALPAPDTSAFVTQEYETPVGESETTVAKIWAEVLKLERVSRMDNFFEIGGHSLLAVRATSLFRQLGMEITVADLFNHPTVKSLATSLYNGTASTPGRGIRLIREGTQTPLFLVHDGYGDELYFSALAQQLPRQLPVYGLPSVPPDEPRLNTLRAMAKRMVSLIHQVQPAGPYRLAGWSFGGVLAYEIAQHLLDQGHTIEFLGLMDAFCPAVDSVARHDEKTPEAVLVELCEEQGPEVPSEKYWSGGLERPDSNLDFDELFKRYRALRMLPENLAHLSSYEAREQCRNLEIHFQAMAAYRPQPIAIPVHLFVAGERSSGSPVSTATLGWERCVPPNLLYTQPVPGSHQSMMKTPHIQTLGRRLTESLAAAIDSKYVREPVGRTT